MFDAVCNPDDDTIGHIIEHSSAKAARRLVDPRNGDIWVWDAALATHAQAAKSLQIPYSNPPGGGEVLINEDHVG